MLHAAGEGKTNARTSAPQEQLVRWNAFWAETPQHAQGKGRPSAKRASGVVSNNMLFMWSAQLRCVLGKLGCCSSVFVRPEAEITAIFGQRWPASQLHHCAKISVAPVARLVP